VGAVVSVANVDPVGLELLHGNRHFWQGRNDANKKTHNIEGKTAAARAVARSRDKEMAHLALRTSLGTSSDYGVNVSAATLLVRHPRSVPHSHTTQPQTMSDSTKPKVEDVTENTDSDSDDVPGAFCS
jgi:hypothetical protein